MLYMADRLGILSKTSYRYGQLDDEYPWLSVENYTLEKFGHYILLQADLD